jgi:ABC-2 type transport system permease protein
MAPPAANHAAPGRVLSPRRRRTAIPGARSRPAPVLVRRAFRDARTRTLTFAYLFGIYAYIQPAGFRSTYPTLADRQAFAHSFAGNAAIRLFYGYPYDPVTIGGYTAWRVGGTLAIAAAAFGVLAAVRALRTEEDTGRIELILAGAVTRRTAFAAALVAVGVCAVVLWFAMFIGYVIGGLPAGGSAYLALATTTVVPVFAGVGAVTSQLAPTRRIALELGSAVVAVSLLLRVIADTVSGAGWVRWLTPLGWAEELRPFTGAQPAVLLLPLVATIALLVIAARIAARRDVGTGLLPARDTAAPRLRLLSSPTAQALRSERGSLIVWGTCFAAFAIVLGMIAPSISAAGISESIRNELAKLGTGSILSPAGYIAFVFIFFILAVCVFVSAQVGAARHEEAEGRLETMLALPVSRVRWFGGRLLLAAAGAASLAVIAGVVTWAGASSQGVNISLAKMLEAAANCLPVACMFLGIAALVYALVPRASAGITYGILAIAFVWYLVGASVGAPKWLVDATPFAHIGFVPTQSFRGQAAAIMVAIGLVGAGVALAVFRRRDLAGA